MALMPQFCVMVKQVITACDLGSDNVSVNHLGLSLFVCLCRCWQDLHLLRS
jgi:hypothetical protein